MKSKTIKIKENKTTYNYNLLVLTLIGIINIVSLMLLFFKFIPKDYSGWANILFCFSTLVNGLLTLSSIIDFIVSSKEIEVIKEVEVIE